MISKQQVQILRSRATTTAWAVLLDLVRSSKELRLWLAALSLLLLAGAYGAVRTIQPGAETFGTTPAFEWSILIAAYVFFVVTTSGLCLVSSLGHVFGIERFKPIAKRAVVLALIFLFAGFGVIALDLHYPLRLAFGVVLSPSPHSAMWWMGTLYSIYMVFLLVELYGLFADNHRIAKAGASLALVTAVAAPSTLGGVFGVLVSRPFWHGSFVPVYLVLSALVSGTAVLGIVYYFLHRGEEDASESTAGEVLGGIGMLLGGFTGVMFFFTVWQTLVGLYGAVPGQAEAVRSLLVGPLAPEFWLFKVLIGILAPLAVLYRGGFREPRSVFLASCLALGGIFMDRMVFVAAGQVAPATAASGIVSAPYASYVPSLVELSIIAGGLGFTALAYTLAERYVLSGRTLPVPARSRVIAFRPALARGFRLSFGQQWRPALAGTFAVTVLGSAALLASGRFPSTTVGSAPQPREGPALVLQTTPSAMPPVSPDPSAPSQMPIHGDCKACHEQSGSIVRVKAIPSLGHPLDGWKTCTSCHNDETLVPVAAGHIGLSEAECLLCHKTTAKTAPAEMPHLAQAGVECTSCHGGQLQALPADHATRSASTCWLCHPKAESQAPKVVHAVSTDLSCRSCHADARVSALSSEHATRGDQTCTLCHEPSRESPPLLTHAVQQRQDYCTFCHSGR